MADEHSRALLDRLERQEARLAAQERLLARYQAGQDGAEVLALAALRSGTMRGAAVLPIATGA